jgi:hypothetical protein
MKRNVGYHEFIVEDNDTHGVSFSFVPALTDEEKNLACLYLPLKCIDSFVREIFFSTDH